VIVETFNGGKVIKDHKYRKKVLVDSCCPKKNREIFPSKFFPVFLHLKDSSFSQKNIKSKESAKKKKVDNLRLMQKTTKASYH
jgi:hypothetical protein